MKKQTNVRALPLISFDSTVFRAQSAFLISGSKFTPMLDHKTSSTKYVEIGILVLHRGANKSLARPGRKQATATEDFDFHISYI